MSFRFKAVLFDWANTLVDLGTEDDTRPFRRLYQFLSENGVRLPAMDTLYENYRRLFYGMIDVSRVTHREACFDQVLNYLLLRFSIDLGDRLTVRDLLETYYREMYAERRVYDDSFPTLEALQQAGVRMGVVSNTTNPPFMKEYERKESGLDPFFEFSIYSSEVPFRKPHPSIFQLAIEKLSLDPGEILFVGDNLDYDVAGPQRMGMPAAWINRKRANRVNGIFPDFELHTLKDLLNFSVLQV